MKTCFLICPIDEPESDIRKRSDTLLEHLLEPVCKLKQYDITRADKIQSNDRIDETIINYLENSDLVIADVSESNSNVFYELGYRAATRKPVIQIAMEGTKLPFDIITTRTHFYCIDNFAKAESFKMNLSAIIDNAESKERERIEKIAEQKTNEIFTTDLQKKITEKFIDEIIANPQKFEEYNSLFGKKN